MHPAVRRLYADRESFARMTVAFLRMEAAQIQTVRQEFAVAQLARDGTRDLRA